MSSDAQFHVNENARAARAAHARLMREAARGEFTGPLYVYYKTRRIEAFAEGECPTGEGWELANPERVPEALTVDQLCAWFARFTGRLPYLT